MSEPPAQPLRFVGVPGNQIGAEFRALDIGDIVTIDYAGASYKARVTARNADYDDFGNEVLRYDLEVTGTN
jgi:hypothetical protein